MARLIFCFCAEDTDIFHGEGLFTATVARLSSKDSANTHEVIGEIFRAMNVPTKHEGQLDDRYRRAAGIRSWADVFPYVNGGLFSGGHDVPRFSRIARSFLIHIGNLKWTQINPDIRSEEHTSELQSLMRSSYAVFCWNKKKQQHN